MPNFRKVVIDELLPHFRRDKRYYFLAGDMGFGVADQLRLEFPQRFLNAGIMEQGAIGIAAGMSMAGLVPIFYSITNFIAFRALEQIRNDIVLQKLNVKLLGTGAENSFRFLGSSHCCGSADATLMNLVGMKVYDPYHSDEPFKLIVDEWITSDEGGYLRV